LLDVFGKSIYHRTIVVALVCTKEPAIDECVDLAAVKLDSKAAISGPTSRPATPHAHC
jgi:hypothetical protein